jgi:hypothetical protein
LPGCGGRREAGVLVQHLDAELVEESVERQRAARGGDLECLRDGLPPERGIRLRLAVLPYAAEVGPLHGGLQRRGGEVRRLPQLRRECTQDPRLVEAEGFSRVLDPVTPFHVRGQGFV